MMRVDELRLVCKWYVSSSWLSRWIIINQAISRIDGDIIYTAATYHYHHHPHHHDILLIIFYLTLALTSSIIRLFILVSSYLICIDRYAGFTYISVPRQDTLNPKSTLESTSINHGRRTRQRTCPYRPLGT